MVPAECKNAWETSPVDIIFIPIERMAGAKKTNNMSVASASSSAPRVRKCSAYNCPNVGGGGFFGLMLSAKYTPRCQNGGWTTLNALRCSWVPHPLGVSFEKGAGFDSLGPPSFHFHISSFYLAVLYPVASKPLIIGY